MSGGGNVPNFNAWLQTAWGAGAEFWSADASPSLVVGFSYGTNPPYTLDDFLSVYPNFFGPVTQIADVAVTANSAQLTLPGGAGLLSRGQFIQMPGLLPPGTLILSVDNDTQITVNNNATDTSSGTLLVYKAPTLPITVLQLYINLASASLVQNRYQERWYLAMSLFVAHYAVMYLRSTVNEINTELQASTYGETPSGALPGTVFTLSTQPPTNTLQLYTATGALLTPGTDYTLSGNVLTLTNTTSTPLYATWYVRVPVQSLVPTTAAKVAARGIAEGVLVSKSVGDVSASYQPLAAMEEWGAWGLTWFGTMLVDVAKSIGAGCLLVW